MPPAALSRRFPAFRAPRHVGGWPGSSYCMGGFCGGGMPVAEHKTEGPVTSVTFLGIIVGTVSF